MKVEGGRLDLEARLTQMPEIKVEQGTLDGQPVVFLDSASTTPKPQAVIDAVTGFYTQHTANVHRGVHAFGETSTQKFEDVRAEVASFLNCSPAEIVFTKNATMSMNMVAAGLELRPDDEVLLTALEHHANYLPWRIRSQVKPVDLGPDGTPQWNQIAQRISKKTRLVTFAHVSNTTGLIAPVEEWIAEAKKHGALTLLDASQSASHLPIDVKALGCDFLAFSGHKLLGPSGVGVLYGRRELLEKLTPFETGGGMVSYHARDRFELREAPFKHEAGTPNIEGVLGLGAAVRYLRRIGMSQIHAHSRELGRQMVEGLQKIRGVTLIGRGAPADPGRQSCLMSSCLGNELWPRPFPEKWHVIGLAMKYSPPRRSWMAAACALLGRGSISRVRAPFATRRSTGPLPTV